MSDEKDQLKGFDQPFEDNPLGEVLEELHTEDITGNAAAYSPLEEILAVDMDFPGSLPVPQAQAENQAEDQSVVASKQSEQSDEELTQSKEAQAYPPAEGDMPFELLYPENMPIDDVPLEYLLGNGEGAFEASVRAPVEMEPEEADFEEPEPMPETARLEEVISSIDDQLETSAEEAAVVSVETVKTQRLKAHQKYVIFSLADARYAVPLSNVIEIGHRPKTTVLPHVPDWLLGVTNRRGDILSVVDLRTFLGITEMNSTSPGRMLVVRTTNDEMTTALIVDQVNKILDLPADQVQKPTAPVETKLAPFMLGVCEYRDELLAVLDLEPILLSDEMRQFEPV